MSLLGWIIFGAIAGFLANKLVGVEDRGCFMNIVLGIAGGVVGGLLFSLLGGTGVTGFNIYSLVVAVIGAVIVLWIARKVGDQKKD